MCLSRPFKRLNFFSLAEKRLLRDFTCGDQHSLLSKWTPRHVVLETKDSSLGPKQMFGKGPIKVFLDNNIRSVFTGWMVMKLFLAQLFKSAIDLWLMTYGPIVVVVRFPSKDLTVFQKSMAEVASVNFDSQ